MRMTKDISGMGRVASVRGSSSNLTLKGGGSLYPWQKGCPRYVKLKDLAPSLRNGWNIGGGGCFSLSPQQEKILSILIDANFLRLSVSYPSFTDFPPQVFEHFGGGSSHAAPGLDMDFVVLDRNGNPGFDPEIIRAFQYLSSDAAKSQGFVGGVGIGVGTADPHLHVDMRHASLTKWIEIDKTLGHEVLPFDSRWPSLYASVKKIYGWDSDDPRVDELKKGFPGLSLALGLIGGAVGYSDGWSKAAFYAAGGFAAGWVVDRVLKRTGVDV